MTHFTVELERVFNFSYFYLNHLINYMFFPPSDIKSICKSQEDQNKRHLILMIPYWIIFGTLISWWHTFLLWECKIMSIFWWYGFCA